VAVKLFHADTRTGTTKISHSSPPPPPPLFLSIIQS